MANYHPDVVFYHYPCSDGITAAAVIANANTSNDIKYLQWNYSRASNLADLIDTCRGKNVLFVDCSAKQDVIEKIAQSAETILIIDHHITAKQELSQYITDADVNTIKDRLAESKIVMVYDVNFSGASLAYKFFHPSRTIPEYIKYIENIDLGKEDLPNASEFKYWERGNKLDITIAQKNIREYDSRNSMDKIFKAGVEIKRYIDTVLSQLLRESRAGVFGTEPFRFVFSVYQLASDSARLMLSEEFGSPKFSIAFYFTATGLGASIRSVEGFDCSVIAKHFGGGGHAQASGFNIKWEGLQNFLDEMDEAGTNLFPPL